MIFGFGAGGATIGYTAGTFIAGIVGVVFIGVYHIGVFLSLFQVNLNLRRTLQAMLTYCLPLSIATMITLLLPQFYAFLLPIHYATDNAPIGNYGVAINFVVLITFFVLPITTMMFPAFSKLDPEKDKAALRNVFQFSVKYGALLVVPATASYVLAEPAVATLFGATYQTAALFLSLLAIQYLYTAFGYLILNALLKWQGKTSFVLKRALLTAVIGFPLGYVLIMNYGVLGLIVTTAVANVPGLIWGLVFVRRTFDVEVDFASSMRILISAAIAGGVTFFVVSELWFAAWLRLFWVWCCLLLFWFQQ